MTSSLFALGSRSMGVNAAKLEAASHNISNANTEGYSRQEVKLATESSQSTPSGFIGRGVRVATIDRASDPYLTREANQSISLASAGLARNAASSSSIAFSSSSAVCPGRAVASIWKIDPRINDCCCADTFCAICFS